MSCERHVIAKSQSELAIGGCETCNDYDDNDETRNEMREANNVTSSLIPSIIATDEQLSWFGENYLLSEKALSNLWVCQQVVSMSAPLLEAWSEDI